MKSRAFQRVDQLKKFLTPTEVFVLKLSLVEDEMLVELLTREGDDKELAKQIKKYCNTQGMQAEPKLLKL